MTRAARVAIVLMASMHGVEAAPQTQEAHPISMGVVLDTSGSMRAKMTLAREVLSQLTKDADSQDEIGLVEASDDPVVLGDLGLSADRLLAYADPGEARGGSALMDAMYLGVQLAKAGRNERRVLLLISDGGDNGSDHTMADLQESIREAGVRVFVVALNESAQSEQGLLHSRFLAQVAAGAGGRHFGIASASDLPRVTSELESAMRAEAQ